jgi:Fe-S-cluster-containing dehydrogenase component
MAYRWGMAVDLDKCTGCEACVTACHAENNIPTVSAEQASRGRAMHWIRVERYFEGHFPDVKVKFRPVLCRAPSQAAREWRRRTGSGGRRSARRRPWRS